MPWIYNIDSSMAKAENKQLFGSQKLLNGS